jgi:hypothetical protein
MGFLDKFKKKGDAEPEPHLPGQPDELSDGSEDHNGYGDSDDEEDNDSKHNQPKQRKASMMQKMVETRRRKRKWRRLSTKCLST